MPNTPKPKTANPKPLRERRTRAEHDDFRGIRPGARFGAASDRYAGWIGRQVYPERYAAKTSGRSRTLGGHSFREEKVPVASVRDYFEHFSTADEEAVCRLLTPRDVKYADAYAEAHPLDAPVPSLSETPGRNL
jgi:hypothetical protein